MQTGGVDEAGIVKRAGEYLVVLRRGRLFSVRVEPEQVALAGARNNVRKVREVLTDQLDISRLPETTTLDTSLIAPGVPNVRVNDGSPTPVKVHVVIESLKPPPGEGAD